MTEIELKAAVRARDGYKCVDCGMTVQEHIDRYGKLLDVHRLVPGSIYTVDGTVTVCRSCHGKRHVKKKTPGRKRFSFVTTKDIRLAVQLAAHCQRLTISDVVNNAIRDALPVELEDARKYLPKRKRDKAD